MHTFLYMIVRYYSELREKEILQLAVVLLNTYYIENRRTPFYYSHVFCLVF